MMKTTHTYTCAHILFISDARTRMKYHRTSPFYPIHMYSWATNTDTIIHQSDAVLRYS